MVSPYLQREAEHLGILEQGDAALRAIKQSALYQPIPVVKAREPFASLIWKLIRRGLS